MFFIEGEKDMFECFVVKLLQCCERVCDISDALIGDYIRGEYIWGCKVR